MQQLTHRRQWLIRSAGVVLGLSLSSLVGVRPLQAETAIKKTRIKNARTVRVVLGERREPAAGVRPDKAGWPVLVAPELAATSAELLDITPGVASSRWVVPVSLGKLVLDTERFLPTHLYKVEFRKEAQVLGTALVYLYPPPVESVARVSFQGDEAAEDAASSLAPAPKGELSGGRSTARAKASR